MNLKSVGNYLFFIFLLEYPEYVSLYWGIFYFSKNSGFTPLDIEPKLKLLNLFVLEVVRTLLSFPKDCSELLYRFTSCLDFDFDNLSRVNIILIWFYSIVFVLRWFKLSKNWIFALFFWMKRGVISFFSCFCWPISRVGNLLIIPNLSDPILFCGESALTIHFSLFFSIVDNYCFLFRIYLDRKQLNC